MTASDILIKRNPKCHSGCPRHRHRNTKSGICPKIAFIVRAICLDQKRINIGLIQCIFSQNCLRDFCVYIIHCFLYTKAFIISFIAVS